MIDALERKLVAAEEELAAANARTDAAAAAAARDNGTLASELEAVRVGGARVRAPVSASLTVPL